MTRTTTGPKAGPITGETALDPRAFGVAVAAVFAVAVVATLAQHASMAAMGGEPMPGGWMASAAWLRPCGRGGGRAFATFAGMWGAMTVTMMLPVLAPQLWHYRRRIGPRAAAVTAWRYGMRAAIRCCACCGNLMVVALAAGMMDLRVMAAVTVAIAAERVVPAGGRVARTVGCGVVAGGMAMIARAAGLA